ncbi:vacuolar import and degradation protein-domain-containing protein [Aspergillus californicus]
MPPVNSPFDARSPLAASSSLQSLPAAVSDDAHDDNVSFLLRSRVRSPPDPSSLLSRQRRRRQHILSEFDIDPMDLDDTNMRMSVEINRRIPIVRRQRDGSNGESYNAINNNDLPNYESLVPNPRDPLYGWAPASDDDDNDDISYPPMHNNAFTSWLDRSSERRRRPARGDNTSRAMPDDPTENSQQLNNTSTTRTLGTEAPQSIPRQPRFSRTRTLHDYLLDRERAIQPIEEGRERSTAASSSRAWSFLSARRDEAYRLTLNDINTRIGAAHRQMHLENPPSPRLKETIRYLDRLRYSSSFEESLTSAAAGGFVQLDLLAWDEDDFILDTSSISPPPECSWLRPGMTFTGSQRATSSPGLILPNHGPTSTTNDSTLPMIVNGGDQNQLSVQTATGRRYFANQVFSIGSGKDENWPVKVTVHNINTQDMTLSGTMEAYNIPDKTSPSHDAHIVTFLEGEIIDFNTHTLETKNFKADAEIDSTYWRELEPFKNLTDEEMTRNLVSRKWITEELCKGWILMRWKERCFITPTDARQGLTISGFYYISLHRESGQIEGLYYDPGSSPYQQLSLKPETEKMVQPSYSFR